MNSEADNVTAPVELGMDLSEYYLNVEWDIIKVPAERRVKKYPCCPEPYPGKIVIILKAFAPPISAQPPSKSLCPPKIKLSTFFMQNRL